MPAEPEMANTASRPHFSATRRRISAPLAIQAVRRAAGIELSAALAREFEGVQIPKFATDEYSCRRVPGVDSSEVR